LLQSDPFTLYFYEFSTQQLFKKLDLSKNFSEAITSFKIFNSKAFIIQSNKKMISTFEVFSNAKNITVLVSQDSINQAFQTSEELIPQRIDLLVNPCKSSNDISCLSYLIYSSTPSQQRGTLFLFDLDPMLKVIPIQKLELQSKLIHVSKSQDFFAIGLEASIMEYEIIRQGRKICSIRKAKEYPLFGFGIRQYIKEIQDTFLVVEAEGASSSPIFAYKIGENEHSILEFVQNEEKQSGYISSGIERKDVNVIISISKEKHSEIKSIVIGKENLLQLRMKEEGSLSSGMEIKPTSIELNVKSAVEGVQSYQGKITANIEPWNDTMRVERKSELSRIELSSKGEGEMSFEKGKYVSGPGVKFRKLPENESKVILYDTILQKEVYAIPMLSSVIEIKVPKRRSPVSKNVYVLSTKNVMVQLEKKTDSKIN